MSDLRHSRYCRCDGCDRARAYLARTFPDPQVAFAAFTALNPSDDPDDVHALTQGFIAAYKEAMVSAA